MAYIYTRTTKNKRKTYFVQVYDEWGRRKTVRAGADRQTAEQIARQLESEADMRRRGLLDPRDQHYAAMERLPLADHLEQWAAVLRGRGNTPKHVALSLTRTRRILDACRAVFPSDLRPSAVTGALENLRRPTADGEPGLSPQTANHHLRAAKSFSRWLWLDGRTREDPLAGMKQYNTATDTRHERRALAPEEVAYLLRAADTGDTWRGMSGADRGMVYRIALGSGLRLSEIRSLDVNSFDLDADPPTITVEAGYSKRRRRDVQPINRSLAGVLKPWLDGKPEGQPVFVLPDKTALMVRRDLDAARGAWIKEARTDKEREAREKSDTLAYRDRRGRVADFHSLRHTYITNVVGSCPNVRIAQDLARHSTPTLTLARYSHFNVMDRGKALERLPETPAPTVEADADRTAAGAS